MENRMVGFFLFISQSVRIANYHFLLRFERYRSALCTVNEAIHKPTLLYCSCCQCLKLLFTDSGKSVCNDFSQPNLFLAKENLTVTLSLCTVSTASFVKWNQIDNSFCFDVSRIYLPSGNALIVSKEWHTTVIIGNNLLKTFPYYANRFFVSVRLCFCVASRFWIIMTDTRNANAKVWQN